MAPKKQPAKVTKTPKKSAPKAKARKTPGTGGEGKFYHIEIRPKGQFTTFRTQDVGKTGGLERVAGKRPSGSWDTA
ncbi:MAG: hypothetical protein AAB901_01460, partial [Patescibacteria group bacterium]